MTRVEPTLVEIYQRRVDRYTYLVAFSQPGRDQQGAADSYAAAQRMVAAAVQNAQDYDPDAPKLAPDPAA